LLDWLGSSTELGRSTHRGYRFDRYAGWKASGRKLKGLLSRKKGASGRQLCRIGATDYNESIASILYPGNTLSQYALKDAVEKLEAVLNLTPQQRASVCLRLDAGFGTDENLDWSLRKGYQLVAKSNSGRRAGAWGERIQDWLVIEENRRWVGIPNEQFHYSLPTRTIAVRWLDRKQKMKHALYVVTDLQHSPIEICQRYDLRGGAEVEIRTDKQGLLLTHRRKRLWCAQEILILLNDLAHNFLSMLSRKLFQGTPLAGFGPYRLIQNVFNIPGEAIIRDGLLYELHLQKTHPYASILVDVLPKLWQ